MGGSKYQKFFYGVVAIAVLVIAYFAFSPGQDSRTDSSFNKLPASSNGDTTTQVKKKTTDSQVPNNSKIIPTSEQDKKSTSTTNNPTANETAILIQKSEVSSTAKFYPYKLDDTNMEIIAVKATDGTIRTALNTCQVCYDSGRGYYVQQGDYLVCQNCGNKFHIDQIEKIKGGCNPVPILETDKKDMGTYVALSKDFIATQKQYFANWKRS